MDQYYWDTKIEYLKNTRYLYFNDDYLEFLVKKVWNFVNPIHIVDFGCGLGYLGFKLLPLLPQGSKYTGIDKGEKLISEAKKFFSELSYDAEFFIGDLDTINVEELKYDVAICQALLLHLPNPKDMLFKMTNSVKIGGKVICIEPHWDSAMANFYIDELPPSKLPNLGILQKLYLSDAKRTGKDGNIGIKIPTYMRELGLKNINCRVSDRGNYLNSDNYKEEKMKLYQLLCEEGFGLQEINEDNYLSNLVERGLTLEEARKQLEIERYSSEQFTINGLNYNTIFAPTMMISYGTKL